MAYTLVIVIALFAFEDQILSGKGKVQRTSPVVCTCMYLQNETYYSMVFSCVFKLEMSSKTSVKRFNMHAYCVSYDNS